MSDNREKRRLRIRNHIAKDLREPLFRQRIKESKHLKKRTNEPDIHDWDVVSEQPE